MYFFACMRKHEIDTTHLVMNAILRAFPTSIVEKNLSTKSLLVDDLELSSMDIYFLGLEVERDLQRMGFGALSDALIVGWKSVQDIIDTVILTVKNTGQ